LAKFYWKLDFIIFDMIECRYIQESWFKQIILILSPIKSTTNFIKSPNLYYTKREFLKAVTSAIMRVIPFVFHPYYVALTIEVKYGYKRYPVW